MSRTFPPTLLNFTSSTIPIQLNNGFHILDNQVYYYTSSIWYLVPNVPIYYTNTTRPLATDFGVGLARVVDKLFYSNGFSWSIVHDISYFTSLTKPTPSAFGIGMAVIDNQLFYSNGIEWVLNTTYIKTADTLPLANAFSNDHLLVNNVLYFSDGYYIIPYEPLTQYTSGTEPSAIGQSGSLIIIDGILKTSDGTNWIGFIDKSTITTGLDDDLNAIAVLDGTTGYLKKTAVNTWMLDTNVVGGGGSSDWVDITNTPTTLSGYGITDAYTKLETDNLTWSWGDITSGKPTTLSGYGITDAALSIHNHNGVYQPVGAYLKSNQTITLSGDVSGSGTTSINVTLGTVPISKGGTGQTTAGGAFDALAPSQLTNEGLYLGTDGSMSSWSNPLSTILDQYGNIIADIVPRRNTLLSLNTTEGTPGEIATASDTSALTVYKTTTTLDVYRPFDYTVANATTMLTNLPLDQMMTSGITSICGTSSKTTNVGSFLSAIDSSNKLQYSPNGLYWYQVANLPTSSTKWNLALGHNSVNDTIIGAAVPSGSTTTAYVGSINGSVFDTVGSDLNVTLTLPSLTGWTPNIISANNVIQTAYCIFTATTSTNQIYYYDYTLHASAALTLPITSTWTSPALFPYYPRTALPQFLMMASTTTTTMIMIECASSTVPVIHTSTLPSIPTTGSKFAFLNDYILLYSSRNTTTLQTFYRAKISDYPNFVWEDITSHVNSQIQGGMGNQSVIGSNGYIAAAFRYDAPLRTVDFYTWETFTPPGFYYSALGNTSGKGMIGNYYICDLNAVNVITGQLVTIGTNSEIRGPIVTISGNNVVFMGNSVLFPAYVSTIAPSGFPKNVNTQYGESSISLLNGGSHTVVLNPPSVLASESITLPLNSYNGQEYTVIFGGTIAYGNPVITALTVTAPAGTSLIGAAVTTANSGLIIKYRYCLNNKTWYRIQ